MNSPRTLLHAAAGLLLFVAAGCDRAPTDPSRKLMATSRGATSQAGTDVVRQDGSAVPSDLVTVSTDGGSLTLWPYTGSDLAGHASDPVNLVFTGDADPGRVRDALLGLDGDRTRFGFPAAYPFDARWSDAIGDVHATYTQNGGWSGSVIQLQLGAYEPVRVHLRLFRAGNGWTVGAAHFEVEIPGTADHQVLSWELAEKVVVADLARSGLLDPSHPYEVTDAINPAPGFRTIPSVIYNQLPPELLGALGGPATPVSQDVPIPTDGHATMLHLARHADPVTGTRTQSFTLQYQQVIPKPFCSEAPADWLLVTGPVVFTGLHTADGQGGFTYSSSLSGQLMAQAVDLSSNPPKPVGAPFPVQIEDRQSGVLDATSATVTGRATRLAIEGGGSEFRRSDLRVSSRGATHYLGSTHCQ